MAAGISYVFYKYNLKTPDIDASLSWTMIKYSAFAFASLALAAKMAGQYEIIAI